MNTLLKIWFVFVIWLPCCEAEEIYHISQPTEKSYFTSKFVGKVVPHTKIPIYAPASGVMHSYFEYGAVIKEKDKLFDIRSDDIAFEKQKIELALLSLQHKLANIASWEHSYEVHRAIRKSHYAKDMLLKAKKRYNDSQQLYDLGIISQDELDGDHASWQQAQEQLEDTNNALARLKGKVKEYHKTEIELEYNMTKKVLAELIKRENNLVILAQGAGVLVWPHENNDPSTPQFFMKQDRKVAKDEIIGSIAVTSPITLSIEVNEWDIQDIFLDQKASISFHAYQGSALDGKVISISNQPINGESMQPRYAVLVQLTESSTQLLSHIRLGMIGDITILSECHGIRVPRSAIVFKEGQFLVDKLIDKEITRDSIRIGKIDHRFVEVLDGVKYGERIVIHSAG